MEIERATEHFDIHLSDGDPGEDVKTLHKNLVRYVESHVGPSTFRELTLTIKDKEGALQAGLNGQSNWQWLFIKMVWVAENLRYKGVGTKLLKAAENEARRRGLRGVWLDTFSFQSPDFYKKHGYTEFGAVDDYPFGHRRHFLFKRF